MEWRVVDRVEFIIVSRLVLRVLRLRLGEALLRGFG